MNTGQISNPSILIRPSNKLKDYIYSVKINTENIPDGIRSILFNEKTKRNLEKVSTIPRYFLTEEDKKFITTLNLPDISKDPFVSKSSTSNRSKSNNSNKLLNLQDLYWLYDYIKSENEGIEEKIYFHELFEESEIILPKNKEIPRNEELNERCKRLKAEQQNRDYRNMTKNVDSTRVRLPEDTIAYQLKQMNRHLIAIFQFIVSVAAGFAFGFIGVELILGSLDFGFRLLLGIICALIIALAELYFLAKRLNEDLQFEYSDKAKKNIKID